MTAELHSDKDEEEVCYSALVQEDLINSSRLYHYGQLFSISLAQRLGAEVKFSLVQSALMISAEAADRTALFLLPEEHLESAGISLLIPIFIPYI